MITYSSFGNNGRLGNQLFQFAFMLNAAKLNNIKTVLPFNKDTQEFEKLIQTNQIENLLYFLDENEFKVITNANFLPIEEQEFSYNEECSNFIKNNLHKHINIKGYFQSEKNFLNIKNDLKAILGPQNKNTTDEFKKLKELIAGHPSTVSVHVRRTDYLNFQHYHTNILDRTDYYKNAFEYMESKLSNPKYVFFSDDIEFCIEKFADKNAAFISLDNSHEEIWLQSLCNHNIIANSSFSWWGAFLNKNENKIVTAPKKWFEKNGPKDFQDIYCEGWIVL